METVRSLIAGSDDWVEVFPGDHVVGVELQSVVKDLAVSNSHWVGSNRMERVDEGDDEGKTGFDDGVVVSTDLKVRGVEGCTWATRA